MPDNVVSANIKEAKFVKALIENNGNATQAYRAISPECKDTTAASNGSKFLAQLRNTNRLDIQKVLEDIGATPKVVLGEALNRATKSKGCREYLNTARFLAKVGRWDQQNNILAGLGDSVDLETIDIVRVRLKKKRKEERIVDVDITSKDDNNNVISDAVITQPIDSQQDK